MTSSIHLSSKPIISQEQSFVLSNEMPNQDIEDVLKRLKDINFNEMGPKKAAVLEFTDALKEEMQNSSSEIISQSTFIPTGSTFERTAVQDETDFDILMILPLPYRGNSFQVLNSDHPGFYKLRWRENGSILAAAKLLCHIFKEMKRVLFNFKKNNPEWGLYYQTRHSSISAVINGEYEDERLSVDIIPQIGYKDWDDLPGICDISYLPGPLQDCVNNTGFQYPIFFSLVPAPYLQKFDDAKELVTTSFSMMEKHCMKKSHTVRKAVLLAKLVSQSRGWKRGYGLRSFHIKRLAIKHYNGLHGLTPWKAFQRLLSHMSSELSEGKIDGYFIDNQDVFHKNYSQCTDLAADIKKAKGSVNPNNLKYCLSEESEDENQDSEESNDDESENSEESNDESEEEYDEESEDEGEEENDEEYSEGEYDEDDNEESYDENEEHHDEQDSEEASDNDDESESEESDYQYMN